MVPQFRDRLQAVDPAFATFADLQTLQINLGNLCNLHCVHCHVNASRRGSEVMGVEIIEEIALFLARHPYLTLDITGGCPEMNPHFRTLIERTAGLAAHRLLRSNLAIMAEPGWEWLPEYCRQQQLTVIGSLPCYLEKNVDEQRGQGVYQQSIRALKALNALGYGRGLELNLVYNPGGDFIPGRQSALEDAYKAELKARHNIEFHHLFTITNAPIGRFRDHLEATGSYANYLQLLARRFNPEAAEKIMCRTLISVDWQGKIYNCDFNQALGMAITADDGAALSLADLVQSEMVGKKIALAEHCYCCTAGEGSSCSGALLP